VKLFIGALAPDFLAHDQNMQEHSLARYQGKYLLLYFYPKDDTPGCTVEACAFRDNMVELQKKIVVLGISPDTIVSHQRFALKNNLPFPLLADPDKHMIQAYGANGVGFPKRVSFLINPEGRVVKIYEKVNVKTHANEILKDVVSLKT
jgi:peroxiredoxin Q/BCP